LSPFVGRTPELAALQARWAQVTAGRGQVVGMVGEPGMGKSRLLDEFRQSVASTDGTYLEGRCLPHGHDTPYLPLLAILRQACDITEVDSAEVTRAKGVQRLQDLDMAPDVWAPCLLHLLGLSEATDQCSTLRPPAMQDRIVEFLWQLSARSSRQRPVILVIEDMQWVDAALDACLVLLAQRLAGMPLLLLVTYRPGYRPAWLDKSYAVQLALMPPIPRRVGRSCRAFWRR
jgi:predicted ATPase